MKKIVFSLPTSKLARFSLLLFLAISKQFSLAMDDERRPNEHFCPLTLQVMSDPVVAPDGHSYERTEILKHLANSSNSPITGLPFRNKELVDNRTLKIMINEWRPGKQGEPSVLETRSAEEIAHRVKEEFDKNAGVFNSAKGQNIVVFLGNTGAGKSTLVNFLAGKELKIGPYADDFVLANPADKEAMTIGTGGNSETLYPQYIDVDGLRFFDLPGFNDTDGSERNLVNAAFIRQILLDAASVRLVFVAGQDQFTADRSASVKQMFNCIKQLFVVGQNISLVDDAVFIATKVTWNKEGELAKFLLHRSDTKDKGELNAQLKIWDKQGKLSCMFSPIRGAHNEGGREEILAMIKHIKPALIQGINVSVLYPPDTKAPLERLFGTVLTQAFQRKLNTPLSTISDYDKAMTHYISDNIWQMFDAELCREDVAIGLLKEFCVNQYNKAFKNLKSQNEGKRQAYIQNLKKMKQARIADIEKRTEARLNSAITVLVPQNGDDSLAFDFAYHKDLYNHVCGADSINYLATDAPEQEVVRQHYAELISRHSHEQMKSWFQEHSGIAGLVAQIEGLTKKLLTMEATMASQAAAAVATPAAATPATATATTAPDPAAKDKTAEPVSIKVAGTT